MSMMETSYAPAERLSSEAVQHQEAVLSKAPFVSPILDFVKEIIVVLNDHRQIVFANKALLNFLKVSDRAAVIGTRPGESLHCIHADEGKGGCGTSESCRYCGAVNAILACRAGGEGSEECRIIRRKNSSLEIEAMDLRVSTAPFVIHDQNFILFTATDISHEKRKRLLERIFYHDILNTAGTLRGLAQILQEGTPEESEYIRGRLLSLSNVIVDEIQAQREIASAEAGDLTTHPQSISAMGLVQGVVEAYLNTDIGKGSRIQLAEESVDTVLETDPTLLNRVIVNMLKNALEAPNQGDPVILGCRPLSGCACFWVKNSAVMPRDVQLQVFQRSFSTKGHGRGLGTYSMKILTETYLKGRISFHSAEPEGTTFTAVYPLSLPR